jgi:ATP-dependent protease ClpP protease subunit
MAILGVFIKQPHEVLDYDFDYSEWLPTSDIIVSTAAVADAGITLGSTIIDPATKQVVKQWVSGGADGTTYKIQITATTAGGRVKEIEFKIRVREY